MTIGFHKARKIKAIIAFALVCIMSSQFAMAQEASSAGTTIPTDEASIGNGKSLFSANCKTCHAIDKKLVGPALQGVYDRTPSVEWILGFVKNSQKVIQSGDAYANDLYAEYNQTQMTAFADFSDEEVLSILAYIKQETDNPTTAAVAATATEGGATEAGGDSVSSSYVSAILIALLVVLALILVVLVMIISVLTKHLNNKEEDLSEAEKEVTKQSFTMEGVLRAKPFIFAVAFVFTALAFKAVISQVYSVGIQIGYAPEQPIKFSHKLHAGEMEIDCNYCHTGVMKSKNANIPSANICLNCHSQIKTESAQIKLIYDAVDNNKPIEWVRVHNLPDLAYFNHSQHHNVAGIECQTCHGEVQEMEVVEQHSLLTMGWCIECHRKTDVNVKGNAYYDDLVKMHDEAGKGKMKVEDIGGLECSKCHY